ncbi:LysR family transcriptional regulator [Candidimonas nitroreducens]|uniref:LysR family transcriptional regulator n=1 Tax=Candidimonas nitroreducens TaxID=683354 RepID=A0A225MR62_9BURK|nr:LysR family transcriptional regulator [Candidimonas nitroreducens]OWT63542.1 LysR family transcriptional regulator [Candidimonas nitroreducens]
MDSISDLALFELVARQGSLTAAARELGVTTPSVSKRLSRLEKRLGVRLLHRTTRQISLTNEGELYLVQGSRILADVAELEQAVTSSRAEPAGLLRVNASFGFGRMHVAPAVARFVDRYPAVEVQLQLSDRPMSLPEQAFDVGIRFGELPDARIHARRLIRNRRIVCAAPGYLERHGVPKTPRELAQHQCLVLRENDSAYGTWHFARGRQEEAVKVRGPLSSNDGFAVLQWALNGNGVAIRSQWEVDPYLGSGALVELLPDWVLPNADIYAVYLERRQRSARLRTFIDFLAESLPKSVARAGKNPGGSIK